MLIAEIEESTPSRNGDSDQRTKGKWESDEAHNQEQSPSQAATRSWIVEAGKLAARTKDRQVVRATHLCPGRTGG